MVSTEGALVIALAMSGVFNVVLFVCYHSRNRDRFDDRRGQDRKIEEAHSNGFIRGKDATLSAVREVLKVVKEFKS